MLLCTWTELGELYALFSSGLSTVIANNMEPKPVVFETEKKKSILKENKITSRFSTTEKYKRKERRQDETFKQKQK